MHTLLDLRGNIPSFIHVSDGKLHDVHALDLMLPEPGAIYVMDRGYVDFTRLHAIHRAGAFFVTRAKSNMNARRVSSTPTDRSTGIICDQSIALKGHYTGAHYPERLRRVRFKDAETSKTLVFLTNHFGLPPLTIAALYKNRWQVELFFKWIKQHLRIKQFLRHVGKRREDADMDRRLGLCPRRHRKKAPRLGGVALHIVANFLDRRLRENTNISSAYNRPNKIQYFTNN
jgi:IS4 transposase